MRRARYVLFIMSDNGNEYVRAGKALFDSVAEACTAGFLVHCKQGNGNRPYLVLSETEVGLLESLDADFARTEAELHSAVAFDDVAILSVQELRSYLLNHGPELDTVGFDYLLFAQSYGADNCHERHETRYGCDCWVGMTDEDTDMLLDEVSENTSTYPGFKLVARQGRNVMDSQEQHANVPGGMASAMAKLSRVIAARELNGARLTKTQIIFLEGLLADLETSAAMYED
jgi:hypothetical protein